MKKLKLIGIIILLFACVSVKSAVDNEHKLSRFIMNTNIAVTHASPNPFSRSTTIYYAAEKNESVTVAVYSSMGKLIAVLFDDEVEQGMHYEFNLDAGMLETGAYFYTIKTSDRLYRQRLEIIR